MKPRTAADILMSARATLPNPRSAHGRSASHGANHFASPFQPSGRPLSYGSALSWQQTTPEQSGMNMNHQDNSFSAVPLRLPLSPAVNELDDCPLRDLHMLSDLKPQDVTDLRRLSEDATRELPSSNVTQFSHFSGNTQRPKLARLKVALGYLRLGRLSPIDLLIHVLDPATPENDRYRTALYKEDGRLAEVMDIIMADDRGSQRLWAWMRPHAVDRTCEIIEGEMEVVKEKLSMRLEDVTPDYISKWTVEATVGLAAQNFAPVLYQLLVRAAQTDKAQAKNVKKKPHTVRVNHLNVFSDIRHVIF